MKPFTKMELIQISFMSLLSFTLLINTALSYAHLLPIFLSCAFCALLYLLRRYLSRPPAVYLMNYTCYTPPPSRKCPLATCEKFVYSSGLVTPESIEFMRNIYKKSGLGEETYAPPFIFKSSPIPTQRDASEEAQEGMFSAVDSLLSKTGFSKDLIDVVIVTSGGFSPVPSLSSHLVNRYDLKPEVKTYNLSGMGCSSGVLAIDTAARILRSTRKVQNALVVISESISLNWYSGDNRSMLVTNCIFRVGCAAAILTNDPKRRHTAKMEMVDWQRTHHGADDAAYCAAFQEEDDKGYTGISLTKDLIRVAGVNLREHIKILAPRVLPLSQLAQYLYSAAMSALSLSESKPVVPDFTTAFEHICIHTGGKAVIQQVARVLRLGDFVTEPARMSLHRFGNTSSSLVFYELAYFEAKNRVKKGDRMWMIAFGTGFKVGSLVWKWVREPSQDIDNPWGDCIHNYPIMGW